MAAVCTDDRTCASSRRGGPSARGDRGAILVQTAVMMIGLTAFSAFIVDYGILWTARRQIQNAADAAALAAAISLGFDAPGDQARARENAFTAVTQNPVWGLAATMQATDVTFPACPSGSVGPSGGVCVRVQAFRNQQTPGTPLPTIFAQLANVPNQGVRATATAQVLFGSSTDCVRPMAIPDKWQELRGDLGPTGWDPLDTFDRYSVAGVLLAPADYYELPSGTLNGTGYSRGATATGPADYGAQLRFAPDLLLGPAGNEQFLPVGVSRGYALDLASCSPRVVSPGDDLLLEPNLGSVSAATASSITALIGGDPSATWDPAMNGGRGGVSGGCMSSGGCTVSPRIIAVPAFDPDAWDVAPNLPYVVVSRIVGFFIERYEAPYVVGRLMVYPAAPRSTMTASPQSAFVVSVTLVR